MSTKVLQYIVRFRRDAESLPEQQVFNTPGPAYGFAYNIEVNGGVALVNQTEKPEPFSSPSIGINLDFDKDFTK